MVVSLKANRKRILAFLILAAVVVGACIFLWDGKKEEKPQEFPGGTNEERLAFLQSFGWEVNTEPAETREVMIPAQFNDIYTTYNVMQKAQGFDLKPYAGEVCTQYQYKINNYPDEPEVYATLLVYNNLIIGGDVACSEVNGFMHGFAADSARYGETSGGSGSGTENASSVSPEAGETASEAPESSAPESSAASDEAGETSAESTMGDVTESDPEEAAESTVSEATEEATEETAGEVVPEEAYPTD